MKTSLIVQLTGLLFVITPFFCGCSEKEEGNNNPILIYTKGQEANITKGKIVHTSSGIHTATLDAKFVCAATREVPSDVEVHLSVDNTLVAAYNTQYGTNYLTAPEGCYEFSHNATALIKSGMFHSTDTIMFSITQPGSFTTGNYLLPVKLSPSVHQPSSNLGVVYVFIEAVNSYFHGVSSAPAGTPIDPAGQGWSVTADKGTNPGNILTSSRTAYWSVTATNIPATAIIDLKSQQALKGLKLSANSTSYAIGEISLAWSDDGIRWNDIGKEPLLQSVNQSSFGVQYIEFYTPITTRYITLVVEKPWSSNVRLSMFSIIVE